MTEDKRYRHAGAYGWVASCVLFIACIPTMTMEPGWLYPACILGGLGLAGFAMVMFLVEAIRFSPGGGAAKLLLGGFFSLMFLGAAFPGCACGSEPKARNASLQANVNTVRLGLEQYSTDHNGHYPASDRWIIDLSTNNYLPDNRMPGDPWMKDARQLSSTIAKPAGLPTAVQIAKGTKLEKVGRVVGVGHAPDPWKGPLAPVEYGAIVYDRDPESDTYVLYGIGEKDGHAIVSTIATNNGD